MRILIPFPIPELRMLLFPATEEDMQILSLRGRLYGSSYC